MIKNISFYFIVLVSIVSCSSPSVKDEATKENEIINDIKEIESVEDMLQRDQERMDSMESILLNN